jgi:hypothetical protein
MAVNIQEYYLTKKEKEYEERQYEFYCKHQISDEDTYEDTDNEDYYDSPKYLSQLDKIIDCEPCE